MTSQLSSVGACLRMLASATLDDKLLAKFLVGTDLSLQQVRDPRSWEDARPPKPYLAQLAVEVIEHCHRNGVRSYTNGGGAPAQEEDCGFKFQLGSELFGQPVEMPGMLVERVLTAGGISVVYGGPNSGKTFLMLSLACSIARGIEWLDSYRVQRGAVLYLASEGPRSVKFRLQAYQHCYGCEVELLAIVGEPINLFASEIDALGIVKTIDAVERACGWPVRLLVGDTLASMVPGANENHGADMSVVLGNIDRIVCARPVHFAVVHHSGKDEARGMRGWSGLNARTDTAIEVLDAKDENTSHSAEIVKQRDIAGRREKITFALKSVDMGLRDNFDNPLTSCVVETSDKPAPEKRSSQTASRESSGDGRGRPRFAEGLILGCISGHSKGISRGDLVKHFQGKPSKTTIYRVIEDLLSEEKIVESAGVIRLWNRDENGSSSKAVF